MEGDISQIFAAQIGIAEITGFCAQQVICTDFVVLCQSGHNPDGNLTMAIFIVNGGRTQSLAESSEKESAARFTINDRPGWYEGEILFKRVVPISGTNKFQYTDTRFKVRCKARNAQECYERIVGHLRSRQDVDPRSQFPSVKGKNFSCSYLGMTLEEA